MTARSAARALPAQRATGHDDRASDRAVPVHAEIPGVVMDLYVGPGEFVADGEPVALLESMKMEIPVLAEAGGAVLSLHVEVGSAVRLGDLVATVRPEGVAPIGATVPAAPVAGPTVPATAPDPARPEAGGTVCVVVPTRNEADNVAPLVERLAALAVADRLEVLFVDDSDDDTPDRVRAVAESSVLPVGLLHREPADRDGGLGGAVVAGAERAGTPWVVVMDGDLQHPPEVVADLVATLEGGEVDLVVASRYVGDGSAAGLASRFRGYVSTGAGGVARMLFPRKLGPVTDPMSGFFAVRTALLRHPELHPSGFKILLEVLMRAGTGRVREVPMTFGERLHGRSKAGLREGLRFARQVLVLGWTTDGTWKRLARFGTVGVSGLLVNLLALRLLLLTSGADEGSFWAESVVATLATQVAIVWNFALTELWVFRGRTGRAGLPGRFAAFWALGMVALAAQLPLAGGFQLISTLSYFWATTFALVVLSVLRFTLLDRLLYRRARVAARAGEA